jgi:hypothetical protein
MTNQSGECAVISVRNYLLFKLVCFQATNDCSYSRLMVVVGGHSFTAPTFRYALAARSTVCLPYPFWKHFQVGQTVNFNALAMHPFARWQGLLT